MAGFASSFGCVLLISSVLLASYACASEVEINYSSLPIVKGLSWSFYESSCPKLESVVRKELKKIFNKDIGQAAGLLRLHFHDCFVQVTKIHISLLLRVIPTGIFV
jgi:peroxidase